MSFINKQNGSGLIIGLVESAVTIILFVIALIIVYNYVSNSESGIIGMVELGLLAVLIFEQAIGVAYIGYKAITEEYFEDVKIMENYVQPLGIFIGMAILAGITIVFCEYLLVWTTGFQLSGDILAIANLIPIVMHLVGIAVTAIVIIAYLFYYNNLFLEP